MNTAFYQEQWSDIEFRSSDMSIKTRTIRHILISTILATDTLCTTDFYNTCYAIDMHATCMQHAIDMPYIQIRVKDVYRTIYTQTSYTIGID